MGLFVLDLIHIKKTDHQIFLKIFYPNKMTGRKINKKDFYEDKPTPTEKANSIYTNISSIYYISQNKVNILKKYNLIKSLFFISIKCI